MSSLSPTMDLFSSRSSSPMFTASEKALRQSPQNRGQLSTDDKAVVPERINSFLRRLYPNKTAEAVSADTGIPASTVAKWLARNSAPSAWAAFRLLAAYGPEFGCAVYENAPDWLNREARERKASRLKAEMAVLEAKLRKVEL